MSETTAFSHMGTIGDVWAAIPAMNQYYKFRKKKIILYLINGQPTNYYEGAVHPTTDPNTGELVMLNESMIKMMTPLLKAQKCIADVKIWEGEEIQVDLNKMRNTFVNMPMGCISRWQFYTWPELACDLSQKWLTAPNSKKDLAKGKIIVTRTERYLNPQINYTFLKKYERDILFCGTELEYQIFKLRYNLDIGRLIINDFLELAQALKQCKFHISNQTQAFQISQGLKIPRMVELCSFAPNVIPYGENAYDFYAQTACQYYVAKLNGETEKPRLMGFPAPPIIEIK